MIRKTKARKRTRRNLLLANYEVGVLSKGVTVKRPLQTKSFQSLIGRLLRCETLLYPIMNVTVTCPALSSFL